MIAPMLLAVALYGHPAQPARAVAPVVVTYEVRRGDCLWSIAARELGNGASWPVVYNANRYTVGANPDLIFPGQKIRVILSSHRAPRAVRVADPVGSGSVRRHVRAAGPGGTRIAQQPGPAPIGGTLSCTGLEQLWDAAGGNPRYAFIAAEIAMAESGGRQYAHSPTDDYGYWQINISHGGLATYDAYGNAKAAIAISGDGTDWYPWTTYTSGAYRGQC